MPEVVNLTESCNYRVISLSSFLGKVYAKCLEKRCREIVELNFRMHNADLVLADPPWIKIFALQQVFEKLQQYAKEVHTCFVDLEKAYDCVPRETSCGQHCWSMTLEVSY